MCLDRPQGRHRLGGKVRFQVRPGLTGLAQVKGRRSLDWMTKLRWDRIFVERDSVRLRLWIVCRTFVVLVRPETVYGDAGKNWRAYLPRHQNAE